MTENRFVFVSRTGALAASIALAAAACGSSAPEAAPAAQQGAAKAGAAAAKSGRPAPSINLAPTDIAEVKRGTLQDGVAVTGDLHPIETVDVRARLEGDVQNVYVRQGDRVGTGQLLATLDASESEGDRASAAADKAAAQSELSTAQWNLDQSRDLYKAGAIAERDLRAAEQAAAAARAKVAAADARLRTTSNTLRDTRVVAPSDGYVSARAVEPGEHVARGATLFTVVRNGTLELAAAVPSRDAARVQVGQRVDFVADGRSLGGRVARVSPVIDPATRSVTVFVQMPNPGGTIRGGTFATGRVVSRTIDNAVMVPVSAVHQSGDGKTFVYRVRNGAIDIAKVQIGATDDRLGMSEVLSGLDAGDKVIVGNVGTALGNGMKVIVAGAEGAGPGGAKPSGPQAR